ncbi:MAG TPA: VOC family protein [Clostridiales bacterium]|nr:VOC family protein [Clostridiales bacterium]HOL90945.1 VOC family protein [Clostridiales bacterium]HPP35117.1 VOC family protein [Clostridiales bacterium]
MHLGAIYLVVSDFEKTVGFYEKLLGIPVTHRNMDRFASFDFEGHNISIMNGHFDADHPDKVVRKGEYTEEFDDLKKIALAPNTRKFVLNFWTEDLRKEHERIRSLKLSDDLTGIKYIYNVSPYYYFQLTDPDGNVIEVTGAYSPEDGELED